MQNLTARQCLPGGTGGVIRAAGGAGIEIHNIQLFSPSSHTNHEVKWRMSPDVFLSYI